MKKLNPLHSNISMHIPHTVLYIFPVVLTRRICLTIMSFFRDHFVYSQVLNALGVKLLGEIRCLSLIGLRGLDELLRNDLKI